MPERPTPGTGDAPLLQRALEEAEQYQALAEGILALSLCRTEPEIFGVLMSRAEKLFPNTHWAVGKLSDAPDGKPEFELQAWTPSVHKQLGDVLKGLRLPIMATGFSHKLYFEHRIVVVEDCPSHPEQFDPVAARRFGLRSLMGVPLVQSGHLVGVLYGLAFLHEPPLVLSELQSSGLQNLCRVSALALDRQRTHAELERQLAAASRLNERMKVFQSTLAEVAGQPDLERALTNLLEVLAEATGYSKWAIHAVPADRAGLHVLAQVGAQGLACPAADPLSIGGPDAVMGGLVVVEDLRSDPSMRDRQEEVAVLGAKSAVSMPLQSRSGDLLGVLSGFGDKPGRPPEEVLAQLRSVADLATLAMERFRLWESLQTELSQRKESEALHRTLVEESLSGVYLIQDGVFQYANPAFCRVFGYTESEMKGMPVGSLVAPSDRETVLNNIRKRVSGQLQSIHYTFRAQRKDRREILVEVHGSTVQKDGRPAVLGVLMDVTEQQRAARAQEASEARYRQLFDDSPEAILLIDPEKGYILVNRAATKLLGRPADQIIGCAPGTLSPSLQRDGEPSQDRAKRVLAAAAGGEPQWFEWVNLRPDGSEVESEAHLVRMRDEGRTVFQLILRDVTAERRERRDREALERQLFQTQKLESLGVMAGGVAHDFNNLLTGILGHADLALGVAGDASALKRHLDALRSAALRASELTKQLLAYSGKGAFELRRVDLSALVEDTARLLEVSVPRAVSLRLDLGKGLPPIQGDPAQLRQVLMNLVINAAESMGGTEGTVRVTTALETLDTGALGSLQGATLAPGPHVILRVADTGCGMDEATLARIFEPFFTTKFTGRGLGLPALLGIVRGHGAGLRVKSEPENGTVFTVCFPAAQGEAEAIESPAAVNGVGTHGTGLVLVVDDDGGVRGVARQTLEMRGYRVLEAGDGSEALDHIRLRGSQIALVVLDATMPNMSGESTLREIRDLLPGLPVLLSSGYDEQATLQRFPDLGRDHFLPKPYGPRELLARVQALLPPR
ncbi:MAG TPA: PAS domain S-box protein [Holophagaceae bacterium]|jgi:PAS domain S-box-containing protein|nr:PAS domain S-box protein [Holophagaceae bacterium]